MIYYAIGNYLAGADATINVSSEDALYVKGWLYDERPSRPFRFTGAGAVGSPEYVCVEFDSPKAVTLAAIFNHNLVLGGSNDGVVLKADDGSCAGASWAAPDYEVDLSGRTVENWNDLYQFIDQTRLAYRIEFIDEGNDASIEIGDLFLGSHGSLANARLQPGMQEGPVFRQWRNVTPYGQHWYESLAYNVGLNLVVKNTGDPAVVDPVRVFLQEVFANNGRFVIIPSGQRNFVYYVQLESDEAVWDLIARGADCEVTGWQINLRTLTKGVSLL